MNRVEEQFVVASSDKGLRFLINGDHASAIQEFNHVIALNPNPGAYALRGKAYFNLGKYNEARSDFEMVLRLPQSENSTINVAKEMLADIEERERKECERKEREEQEHREREERERREREERERKEREHQEWLKTEEGQKWLKDETLSRFNSAKAKIPIMRTADEYGNLDKEFANIEQVFKSLPDSLGVQAQIEECETCRKQCEEKKNQWKKDGFLSLLNAAKALIPTCRTADEYDNLARKFAGIGVDFKSLPDSLGIQAQIEECEACRKQCREKEDQLKAEEEQRRLEDEAREKKKKKQQRIIKTVTVIAVIGILAGFFAYYSQSTPESVQTQPVAQSEHSISDNFVRINSGTFTMGSNRSDEKQPHTVTVNGFYMGKYEVTQKEWIEVMGTNPSNNKADDQPVEQVSWYDAVEYCNKRSEKDGLNPAYTINKNLSDPNNKNSEDTLKWTVTWNQNTNGYRLPTEAEWEYACRAGTTTAYNTGRIISSNTGWYRENSGIKTRPVGQKPANAWGLYDMHGNVWEWCWDWNNGDYSKDAQIDPIGESSGYGRVFRGGSFDSHAPALRSAYRYSGSPTYRSTQIGFRLIRP